MNDEFESAKIIGSEISATFPMYFKISKWRSGSFWSREEI